MKTNKLPQSAWSDSQAAGSQSQQISYPSSRYLSSDKMKQTGSASNDAKYYEDLHHSLEGSYSKDTYFAYKRLDNSMMKAQESIMTNNTNTITKHDGHDDIEKPSIASGYKKSGKAADIAPSVTQLSDEQIDKLQNGFKQDGTDLDDLKSENLETDSLQAKNLKKDSLQQASFIQAGSTQVGVNQDMNNLSTTHNTSSNVIPERVFMNGLIKHTAIALAIIIPLAAFSAYAAPMSVPNTTISTTTNNATTDKTTTATLAIKPSSIIHKSASTPTTVDSVDLEQYAGTWYEIGRLPMYFQRKCASDVTATYTGKTDGSGITVLNKCSGENGTAITAEGLAKPADNTGSKLKVSFLPSWIRWLPVGRADYWVLARDADYKTALVGTPDKKYLWLLARSPNITQQTYAKYREIAQQQGYDLKEFKLTTHSNQTVSLIP
ncbi:lipocalin family protein [Psychrobacter sp. 72-O-c]|uniref:lipocalin family protein n=1 Tax=Psychrobacter sp. 72-O-c TaxID=2774125 RepID=UPI001917B5A6|nr:lipocalin family protein [Psychrobacter sp. 72-O-c]